MTILLLAYSTGLTFQWWYQRSPNLYEITGTERWWTSDQIKLVFSVKSKEMFVSDDFISDEYKELQKQFETLIDPSLRMKYELEVSDDQDTQYLALFRFYSFYAGWLLIIIAITSTTALEQARSHCMVTLALLALAE